MDSVMVRDRLFGRLIPFIEPIPIDFQIENSDGKKLPLGVAVNGVASAVERYNRLAIERPAADRARRVTSPYPLGRRSGPSS